MGMKASCFWSVKLFQSDYMKIYLVCAQENSRSINDDLVVDIISLQLGLRFFVSVVISDNCKDIKSYDWIICRFFIVIPILI